MIDDISIMINHAVLLTETVGGHSERNCDFFTCCDGVMLEQQMLYMSIRGEISKAVLPEFYSEFIHSQRLSYKDCGSDNQALGNYFTMAIRNGVFTRLDAIGIFETIINNSKSNQKSNRTRQKNGYFPSDSHDGAKRLVQIYFSRLYNTDNDVTKSLKRINDCSSSEYYGFDWFAATLFILLAGDSDHVRRGLNGFVELDAAVYLWPACNQLSSNDISFQGRLFDTFSRVYTGIHQKAPQLAAICHIHEYSIYPIIERWIREIWWNVLDFQEIVNYILVVMIFGPKYQAWFVMAVLLHVQPDLISATKLSSILNVPIIGFRTSDYLARMHEWNSESSD